MMYKEDTFYAIILDQLMDGITESFMERLNSIYSLYLFAEVEPTCEQSEDAKKENKWTPIFSHEMTKEEFVSKIIQVIKQQYTKDLESVILKKVVWDRAILTFVKEYFERMFSSSEETFQANTAQEETIVIDLRRLRLSYTGTKDKNSVLRKLIDDINDIFRK